MFGGNFLMQYYRPEIGQALFGQPSKTYECPSYLEAALRMIRDELDMVETNIYGNRYNDVFENSGDSFKCPVFEVESYSWNENYKQPYNFKWKDLEVSWYKYLGRGMSVNKKTNPNEVAKMLEDCLNYLNKIDKKDL
jgi:hypothetical protein